MAECPWYVTAHAVRQYMRIRAQPLHRKDRAPVPGVTLSFDDASDALIEYAAETWQRYQADPARAPSITRTGAYQYRGPGPLRLTLVVSMERRPEGPKPQVVDVVGTHAGIRR
jgi:hypothetical protein